MTRKIVTLDARSFGAKGNGGNDIAAIQTMLYEADSRSLGMVEFDGYSYGMDGILDVPPGITVVGRNMIGPGTETGTQFKLLSAGSKVHCRGTGAGLKSVWINGNAVANVGLQVGGTGVGEAGSDGYYDNLQVSNCTTRNIAILTAQNTLFNNVRSNITAAGGEGVLIDNGVGGCVFNRLECNSAQAGPNLRIGPNAAASGFPTSNNTFIGAQCEFRANDGPELKIEGGFSNSFFGGAMFHSTAGHTSPIVEVTGNSRTYFNGTVVAGNADKLRVGFKVGPGAGAVSPAMISTANIRGFGISAYYDINYTNARVLKAGPDTGLNPDEATGINLLTAATPRTNIVQDNQWLTQYRMGVAADSVLQLSLITQSFPRFWLNADGGHAWGPGTGAAADVNFVRTAAGVLGITGRLTATAGLAPGATTTAGRLGAGTVPVGTMMYDTTLSKPIFSDGAVWRDAAGAAV